MSFWCPGKETATTHCESLQILLTFNPHKLKTLHYIVRGSCCTSCPKPSYLAIHDVQTHGYLRGFLASPKHRQNGCDIANPCMLQCLVQSPTPKKVKQRKNKQIPTPKHEKKETTGGLFHQIQKCYSDLFCFCLLENQYTIVYHHVVACRHHIQFRSQGSPST